MNKSKLGQLVEVPNKDRKFGSSNVYYAVHATWDGQDIPLLMTPDEYSTMYFRGKGNSEDIPQLKISWLQRFINLWK